MDRNNGQKIYKWIMLTIIIVIITSLITAFSTYKYLMAEGVVKEGKQTTSLSGLEYTLSKFRSELEKKYIGEINDEDLIDGAIKGYVAGLRRPIYCILYKKRNGRYYGRNKW